MTPEAYNAGVIYLLIKPNEDETAVHGNLDPGLFCEDVATTAGVTWLCACIRYWPYRGVGTCVLVLKMVLFKNIEGVALNRVYIVGLFLS